MADVKVVALHRFNDGRQWRERGDEWTCELALAQRYESAGHARVETTAAKADYEDKAEVGYRASVFVPPWRRSDEAKPGEDGDDDAD
jgi:hypothetical protein